MWGFSISISRGAGWLKACYSVACQHMQRSLLQSANEFVGNGAGLERREPWCQIWSNPKLLRNKKLLGAPGIATRSKDATRGSWPYY